MKLFNILFLAIRQSEYEFLLYRHAIDSQIYKHIDHSIEVKHLKLKEESAIITKKDLNELFFNGKNRFLFAPFDLYRYIKKEKPEVIMVHGFIFPFQVAGLILYKPKNTKLIVQHHAEKPFEHPIKRWLQRIAYSKADAYIFASEELAEPYLKDNIIKDKSLVHEMMEGSTLFKAGPKTEAKKSLNLCDELIFLWVGRLDTNKDPLTVLEAFRQYKEAGYEFHLYMIYGSTELEKEVKTFIYLHSLESHITLLGQLAHEALEAWYNAADYFVAASYYEGSGIALCEAMACGCIPLVTKISSFSKMTKHGNYGFLFEPGCANELFKILTGLKPEQYKEQSEEIVAHFKRELSITAIGRKTEDIVRSTLKQ